MLGQAVGSYISPIDPAYVGMNSDDLLPCARQMWPDKYSVSVASYPGYRCSPVIPEYILATSCVMIADGKSTIDFALGLKGHDCRNVETDLSALIDLGSPESDSAAMVRHLQAGLLATKYDTTLRLVRAAVVCSPRDVFTAGELMLDTSRYHLGWEQMYKSNYPLFYPGYWGNRDTLTEIPSAFQVTVDWPTVTVDGSHSTLIFCLFAEQRGRCGGWFPTSSYQVIRVKVDFESRRLRALSSEGMATFGNDEELARLLGHASTEIPSIPVGDPR
jgi:hypothetical protein